MKNMKKHLENLKNWIDKFKEYDTLFPFISNEIKLTQLKLKYTESMPSEVNEDDKRKIFNEFEYGLDYWSRLPMIEPINPDFSGLTGFTYSVSGSSAGYDIISELQYGESPISSWAHEFCLDFDKFQQEEGITQKTGDELEALNPGLKNEFFDSLETYTRFDEGVLNSETLGIQVRNVIEGHQGELFKRAFVGIHARDHSRQKVRNWEEMANEIALNGSGSPEHILLIREGNNYANLHRFMTNLAKNIVPFDKTLILRGCPLFS